MWKEGPASDGLPVQEASCPAQEGGGYFQMQCQRLHLCKLHSGAHLNHSAFTGD